MDVVSSKPNTALIKYKLKCFIVDNNPNLQWVKVDRPMLR